MRARHSSRLARCISAIVMLALGVSIGAGAAVMAHGGDSNLVHACVHKNSGNVRIVDANESCRKNEHALDWGIQGPVGPAGNDGADGLNGSAGEDGVDGEDGLDGEKGDPGLVWRGAWDSSAEYAADDAVQYQGSSYVAVASNSNEAPGDGSSWDVLALRGERGSEGPQGEPGTASTDIVDLEARVATLEGLVSSLSTPGRLSIDDAEVTEGDRDTTSVITFTVTLSASSNLTIMVDYTTIDLYAANYADPGYDFIPASGTLSFAPGEVTKTIEVEIIGDSYYENNEYFYVELSHPVNAMIDDGRGRGSILNDD